MQNGPAYGTFPTPEPLAVMRFFSYKHLPSDLASVSKPFADLAWHMHEKLPNCHEKQKSLDALLVAKDAAVRAVLPK